MQAGIDIHKANIDQFLTNLNEGTFTRLKSQHGLDLPIHFKDVQSEITFLTILSVLNTLSAYRAPFHGTTGKGAYQNVITLCVGLYNRHGIETFSAKGLANLTKEQVLEEWKLASESPAEFQPEQVSEPADLVIECCHTTGQALLNHGYATPADLVFDALPTYQPDVETDDTKAADDFVHKVSLSNLAS